MRPRQGECERRSPSAAWIDGPVRSSNDAEIELKTGPWATGRGPRAKTSVPDIDTRRTRGPGLFTFGAPADDALMETGQLSQARGGKHTD